ncbi:MAG TPA: thiamine phosphate synthase, partial [Gemmatimonadales bacterium]|nr:thiamine phosphate synthase [Gemmatimonadales bacterium]
MRPLPRLHAITDGAILALEDFPVRAAAIASAGPAVALHVRDRQATATRLTAAAQRLLALAAPPEAAVIVNARPDIAVVLGAQGVQLGVDDLSPASVRRFAGAWRGWIGRSVHSVSEAAAAKDEGADYLIVGSIYPTPSHPGAGAGPGLITEIATLGLPVIAIGGMTAARAVEVRNAGAYGVAAISAVWRATDSAAAAM